MASYQIEVAIPERDYIIDIEPGLLTSPKALDTLQRLCGKSRLCIVTHPVLLKHYVTPLVEGLKQRGIEPFLHVVPSGEHRKTLATVAKMYDAFIEAKLDRKSLVVVIGGGVLGDAGGFAAASYLRGIRFVQIPTTLLAHVDSSVGGKTGVDLPQGKNLIGSFHQPSSVLIDPITLRTLPRRELCAGLAEVIKYGIIYDNAFFARVDALLPQILKRDMDALSEIIARSCEIKADVVRQDETEQGLRAILNFGHTLGHALEAITNYRRYKHGEAIAIGMVAESRIGECIGQTSPDVTNALIHTLERAHLPTAFPSDITLEQILQVAQRDKKTIGGHLSFVLPLRIGEVNVRNDIPVAAIQSAIQMSL